MMVKRLRYLVNGEWRDTPVTRRVQVMFKLRELLDRHLHDLAVLLATEMGKTHAEARGDVLKAIITILVFSYLTASDLGIYCNRSVICCLMNSAFRFR